MLGRLVTREAWGAAPATAGVTPHVLERITIHHTAVRADERETAVRIRGYQRYHQRQGWPDIAYHLLVGADGLVYEGRSLEARSDSVTDYDTAGHLHVALDGDFTVESPSAAQCRALLDLLAWANDELGLAAETIRGHDAYAQTACPGMHLAALLDGASTASCLAT